MRKRPLSDRDDTAAGAGDEKSADATADATAGTTVDTADSANVA